MRTLLSAQYSAVVYLFGGTMFLRRILMPPGDRRCSAHFGLSVTVVAVIGFAAIWQAGKRRDNINRREIVGETYLLCLYRVEFRGVTFGDDWSPGESGGRGGVIDEMLSLKVEFAAPGLLPCKDSSCNFGSRMWRSSVSTISTHSGS